MFSQSSSTTTTTTTTPRSENYARGYEWELLVEAKKRNPAIKTYGLSWAFPQWISCSPGTLSNCSSNPYTHPEQTASYITKWVTGLRNTYDISLDYVGVYVYARVFVFEQGPVYSHPHSATHIAHHTHPLFTHHTHHPPTSPSPLFPSSPEGSWNERAYDIGYLKLLRETLDAAGATETMIVAPDAGWDIAKDILADPDLAKAVHAIGCHYPGTHSSPEAEQTLKPLWASEDDSTYNNDVGAACWARVISENYVNGNMTLSMNWNLLSAYQKVRM